MIQRFSKLLVSTIFITGLFAVPLLVIFASVFYIDLQVWEHLVSTVLFDYISNSLILAFCVGIGTSLIGCYLAWLMVHYDFAGKSILRWLILLPLAMPAYIIAYTYTGVFDFASPLHESLRVWFGTQGNTRILPDIRNLGGAIAMMILVLYPYVYLLARTAFKEQSSQFSLVAQLAGMSKWRYIKTVALPLARPAILTGAALAMMEALADYGTVAYFGVNTFTTGIYRTWFGMGNALAASQLASLLCLFVFIFLWLEKNSRKHHSRFQARHNRTTEAKRKYGATSYGLFLVCLLPPLFGFVVPFIQLLYWVIEYANADAFDEYFPLLFTSIKLAGISVIVIVTAALIISYCKRQFASKSIQFASQFVGLGYALPGVVIAVGVVQVAGFSDKQLNILSNSLFDYQPGLLISGGITILVFAYAIRYLSVALHNTDTGLERIKPNLDEVAISLKAGRGRVLRTVHAPLISASLISACILVFVDVLKELPATLILRPFNVNTLAVKAYELASDERLIDAALPAVSIVFAGIIPVILLTKSLEKI
ncbi:ABC transporter permease [Glaciecola petra]|uniref:Iron ABC transporter permease n=1 Tax=Glaciecola petra TaxID=3075602 RepID=A0ABU2ZQU4_9ALTE|nr:iron ABC transporter permease [Aestuariibacter sp. P117]MDT0594684.1 iron ABC transporter permease [Aestuariibacter sp. P117]